MITFKRIENNKDGELTFGILLAAIASMIIIAVCLIQMEGRDNLKFGWYLFFVVANIIYIVKYADPDPMNGLVIASGPLAFFFWVIVYAWNKYVPEQDNSISKPVKLPHDSDSPLEKTNNVIIRSPVDVLRDLNNEITEKLERFDVFDIEVPELNIKQFLRVLKERNLDWRPTDFIHDNKETIVVGKKGVDFGQHEKER